VLCGLARHGATQKSLFVYIHKYIYITQIHGLKCVRKLFGPKSSFLKSTPGPTVPRPPAAAGGPQPVPQVWVAQPRQRKRRPDPADVVAVDAVVRVLVAAELELRGAVQAGEDVEKILLTRLALPRRQLYSDF
jgi:hypothetical protein